MDILGVSCYFHDAAAAFLRDGLLVAAAEEERFSRIKHDFSFPRRAIQYCLREAGIRGSDLDYVVFFEKPFRKFDRILMSVLGGYPRTCGVFRESMIAWVIDKLWVASTLEKELGVSKDRILFSEHHLSHAASAFLCSPFEEAAILTVDGVGEWTTARIGVGQGGRVKLLEEILFPHSLGLLYSAFTAFLGFEVNEGEYKVMGMAPFGRPRYVEKIRRLINIRDDGSFALNLEYFCFHRSAARTFNRRFEELFGSPRPPGLPFFTRESGYPSYFGDKTPDYEERCRKNSYFADVAASIQAVTEEILLKMARHASLRTGSRRLCLAGGVALNSAANGRILREGPFEEIYIQPAAGDGGGALGAALHAFCSILGNARRFVLEHAYWGEEHDEQEIEGFLRDNGIRSERIDDEDNVIGRVVEWLQQGKVVGWVQGRFEWGPRALGHRSILADPRRRDMKDTINVKIKFREPFRPFAPSVLAEKCGEYFALPHADHLYPARFMLYVTDVREDKRQTIPAVTHVDGTSRVQVVHRQVEPRYYRLIEAFGEATGVPVLLNTSFNLKGEPIVNTPQEAFMTFRKSGMDALVLGKHLIEKPH